MAIDLIEGLRINGPNPVDTRLTVSDRTSISRYNLYHGLTVFDQTAGQLYVYKGTTYPPASNDAADWVSHEFPGFGTAAGTALEGDTTTITPAQAGEITANTAKRSYPQADETKLAGIETGATADQTGAEIKSLYEGEANTNAFTDADVTKLSGIEDNATADQTAAEIKTAYESNANTNAFTDANVTKLSGIEDNATADQTDAEIKTAYENNPNTNAFTDADVTKLGGIETGADVTDTANVHTALGISGTGDINVWLNERGTFTAPPLPTQIQANPHAILIGNPILESLNIGGVIYNIAEFEVNTNPLVGSNNHNLSVGAYQLQGTSTIQIGPTGELNTRTTYGDGLSFTAGSATASPNVDIDLATDSGLEFDSGDLKIIDVPFTLQSNPNDLTFDTGSNTAISDIVIPHVTSTQLGLMRTTHFDWVERVSQVFDTNGAGTQIEVDAPVTIDRTQAADVDGALDRRYLTIDNATGVIEESFIPQHARAAARGTQGQFSIVNVANDNSTASVDFRPIVLRSATSTVWTAATPPNTLGHVGSLGIDDTSTTTADALWIHNGTAWEALTVHISAVSDIAVGRSGTVTTIQPTIANDDLNISSNGGDVVLENVSHINDVARNTFEYASILVGGRILTTTATITIPAGYNDTDFILYSIDGGTTPQRIRLFRTDGTGEEIRVFHNATSTVGDATTAIIKIY